MNPVFSSQNLASFGRCADANNVSLSKNCMPVLFSAWLVVASLFVSVCGVLGVSSKPQMIWIDATRVVAGVAHTQVGWHSDVKRELKGKPVGENFDPKGWIHSPVSLWRQTGKPVPAFVWTSLVNALPEIFIVSDWFTSSGHIRNFIKKEAA